MTYSGKLSVNVRLNHRTDAEGRKAVLVQVLYQRRRRVIFTPYRVTEEEFDRVSGLLVSRSRCRRSREFVAAANSSIAQLCESLRQIAGQLRQSGQPFDVSDIIDRYHSRRNKCQIGVYVRSLILELDSRGKHGTASTYRTTLSRFERYTGGKAVTFENLTVSMLQEFENHLYACGLQRNTVTFYLRVLRAIYNKAVVSGVAPRGESPFSCLSFREDKTAKLAVDKNVLRKMARSDFGPGTELAVARDLFMFSFYARGMSFVDMAYLRYEQITGDTIRYRRHKSGQPLRIRIIPELATIIERYRDPESPWVLPVLRRSCGEHPLQPGEEYGSLLHRRYKVALNRYLTLLERISSRLGTDRRLTFNVARHSWASLARRKGVPVAVISEGLGHTSEKTTLIYLDELDGTLVDRANEAVSRL